MYLMHFRGLRGLMQRCLLLSGLGLRLLSLLGILLSAGLGLLLLSLRGPPSLRRFFLTIRRR